MIYAYIAIFVGSCGVLALSAWNERLARLELDQALDFLRRAEAEYESARDERRRAREVMRLATARFEQAIAREQES